jgi:hypothetical protein
VWHPGFQDSHKEGTKQFSILHPQEMADPPPNPTPTVFKIPQQQTNRAVDDITPRPLVSQVLARASVALGLSCSVRSTFSILGSILGRIIANVNANQLR